MPVLLAKLKKCHLNIRISAKLCYAFKTSQKILFPANLRLRACLAMCLKYGQSQPKRAYKARAYKRKMCKALGTSL